MPWDGRADFQSASVAGFQACPLTGEAANAGRPGPPGRGYATKTEMRVSPGGLPLTCGMIILVE